MWQLSSIVLYNIRLTYNFIYKVQSQEKHLLCTWLPLVVRTQAAESYQEGVSFNILFDKYFFSPTTIKK